MAVPSLLHGSETRFPTNKDLSRIQADEMRFSRYVKGCPKNGRISNDAIRLEFDICPVLSSLADYCSGWRTYINSMQDDRLRRQLLYYVSISKRGFGKPHRGG